MKTVHVVLFLAAEGGGLKILGVEMDEKWSFKLETIDQTPMMMDESSIHVNHGWYFSLPEVLAKIRWTWNCLYPLNIHPAFVEIIGDKKVELDKLNGGNSYANRRWEKFGVKGAPDIDKFVAQSGD